MAKFKFYCSHVARRCGFDGTERHDVEFEGYQSPAESGCARLESGRLTIDGMRDQPFVPGKLYNIDISETE